MTDVHREVFELGGYTLEIDMLPCTRTLNSVQDGSYDGIIVVGKDSGPNLVYPDLPTVIQRVAFVVNAEYLQRYTGVESLSQAIIGIVKGYHYVDPDLVAYFEVEQRNEKQVLVLHGDGTNNRRIRVL